MTVPIDGATAGENTKIMLIAEIIFAISTPLSMSRTIAREITIPAAPPSA